MTDRERAICECYTGIIFCTGEQRNELYKYLHELFGRPIYTHEMPQLADEIIQKSKADFIKVCKGETLEEQHTADAEKAKHGKVMKTQRVKLDCINFMQQIVDFLNENSLKDNERDVCEIEIGLELLECYIKEIAKRALEINDEFLIELLKDLYILVEKGGENNG